MVNKLYLSLLIGVFMSFLLSAVLAFECQDQTEFWNVPCEVVTPVIICTNPNVSVTDFNETVRTYNTNITAVGDGTYNYTFDFNSFADPGNSTNVSTYSMVLCDNSSASMDIIFGIEQYETNLNLWIVLFSVFFILLLFGIYKSNYIILFIAGALVLIMGVWVFNEGITVYDVSYWWVYPFGWILAGLGILLTVVSGIQMLGGEEE